VVIEVPDFGDTARNRAADEMLAEVGRRLRKFSDIDH
jgi:hypothetical protein